MPPDFRDLLSELLRAQVRFLVVGAHALAVHGVPRATADLDVWIEPTRENARRTWQALAAFGAPLATLEIHESDFATPDLVVQLGLPPVRIDLLTGLSGLQFEEAWADRVVQPFDGIDVPFLGRKAFVQNKRASGRKKDQADLEALGE